MGGRMHSTGMDDITVKIKRTELLEKLRINRARHIDTYNAAVKGYKREVVAQLESELKVAKQILDGEGSAREVFLSLMPPESYADVYDSVIEAWEMDTKDEVELRMDQFRQLVQDQWTWKADWSASTARYAGPLHS